MTTTTGASQVRTRQAGTGTTLRSLEAKVRETVSVTDFGAVANGTTGTNGTDQSTKFQAAVDYLTSIGGGGLFIPYSSSYYMIGLAIKLTSNITVFSDSRATRCQKLSGSPIFSSDPGSGSVFYTSLYAACLNIHLRNFTIDGNKANLTGVIGDGGFFGVLFQGASDSTLNRMTVQNAYTGGVTVDGWGASQATATNAGNNVVVLDSILTASRRNNFEVICGLNTRQIGGENSYATGGSLCYGVDVEPDIAGQFVNGFQMVNVAVHHNRDGGIIIQSKYDSAPSYAIVNCNVYSNTGPGLNAIDYNSGGGGVGGGTLSIVGGVYANNTGAEAINLAGWSYVNVTGQNSYGSARGLLVSANVTNVMLGPGMLSGTTYDLSVEGPNSIATMAGVTLANGVIQPGQETNVKQPLSGIPVNFTDKGLAYWPSTTPRTGAMAVSARVTINESVTNPDVLVNDGSANVTVLQTVNSGGTFSFVGSQSSMPAYFGANNSTNTGGVAVGTTGTVSVLKALTAYQFPNYIASESGVNNALVATLTDTVGASITVAAGLRILLKLAHTLQVGANTLNLNSSGVKSIFKHTNPASNLSTGYAVGSVIDLFYDGTQYQDMSQ